MPAHEIFPGCTMITMESPDDIPGLVDAVAAAVGEDIPAAAPAPEFEVGLTGPDWEPDDATRYYAQWGKAFEFGPTLSAALAALIASHRVTDADREAMADRRPRLADIDINAYQEIDFVPAYVAPVWSDDKRAIVNRDVLKYGGKKAPPPIGAEIVITINSHGPARVAGYFMQDGFLGVLTVQDCPRPGSTAHKTGDLKGHVFGPEFESAAVKPFDGTGTAYDSCNWDERIRTGDTLLIEAESVVGLAWAWPIAVTVESGHLHAPMQLPHADLDRLLKDAGIHPMQVKAAVAVALAYGFKVRPDFERFKDQRFHAHALISRMARDAMAVGPDSYISVMGVHARFAPGVGVVWAHPARGEAVYARDAAAAHILSQLES